jgi:tRNA threonylcarbamoyladenosine biosynthesis protein TsaB
VKILAFDTATESLSVALSLDGVVTSFAARPGRGHGAQLLAAVDELLVTAGIGLQDLDLLAVGRGPGAFTGVRIGVSVAQGLGLAMDLPIVPVSDLAALALGALEAARADGHLAGQPAGESLHVLACLDARLGGLYAGCVTINDPHGPDLTAIALLAEELTTGATLSLPAQGALIVAGHGLAASPDLAARLDGRTVVRYPALLPDSAAIAALAVPLAAAGHAVSARDLAPTYLRDDVATRSARAPGGPRPV